MITEEQARDMKPGTVLSFNTPGFYKVLSVSRQGETLTVDTVRDDGTRIALTLGDLAGAEFAGAIEEPKSETEPEPKPESDLETKSLSSRRARG